MLMVLVQVETDDVGARPPGADWEGGGGLGPLSGVRVLDLSRVLAGPWCTQSLADLGAEVLKIESPGEGDETRGWVPPYAGEQSAYFSCANRSKRSLVVDLKCPSGQKQVFELAKRADVMVDNFKTGTLERFGLDNARLSEANPRLVQCSISGYGRSGPSAGRPGYDFIIQGESGLMSVTGVPDGPPMKVGVAVSDLFAGLYASQAILAALFDRERTGRGRFIDVALFDCQLAALANVQSSALATGESAARYGNAHPTVAPYQVVDAADGPFIVAIGNNRQFQILCRNLLGDEDLANDIRFATNGDRIKNRAALDLLLQTHFRRRSSAEWLTLFKENDIPGGLVKTVKEALESDQTMARGLIRRFGDAAIIGYPVKITGGLPEPFAPPALGEGGSDLAKSWLASAPGAWARQTRAPEQIPNMAIRVVADEL